MDKLPLLLGPGGGAGGSHPVERAGDKYRSSMTSQVAPTSNQFIFFSSLLHFHSLSRGFCNATLLTLVSALPSLLSLLSSLQTSVAIASCPSLPFSWFLVGSGGSQIDAFVQSIISTWSQLSNIQNTEVHLSHKYWVLTLVSAEGELWFMFPLWWLML